MPLRVTLLIIFAPNYGNNKLQQAGGDTESQALEQATSLGLPLEWRSVSIRSLL